jgi:hypothetical protein
MYDRAAPGSTKTHGVAMIDCMRALQEYETSNNSFDLLCGFIGTKNSDLINLYCSGKLHLPSFIVLKKLRLKFMDLVQEDEELNILFRNIIQCSKLFYAQTIHNINRANNSDKNFEHLFTKHSQPLGQRLISLLLNIKYRIRIARLKRQKSLVKQGILKTFSLFTRFVAPIFYAISSAVYQIRLLQSAHNVFSRKIYYLTVIATIAGFWFINSELTEQLPPLSIALINCIFCVAITILATLAYPSYDFEFIDIDGKNIIAYKYQAFFNSLSNKKLYKIFTLQYTDDSRQIEDLTLESPQY